MFVFVFMFFDLLFYSLSVQRMVRIREGRLPVVYEWSARDSERFETLFLWQKCGLPTTAPQSEPLVEYTSYRFKAINGKICHIKLVSNSFALWKQLSPSSSTH